MSETTETVAEATTSEPVDGIFDPAGDAIDFTPAANGAGENNGEMPTTTEKSAFELDPDEPDEPSSEGGEEEEAQSAAPEEKPSKPPRMIKVGDSELPADQIVDVNGESVPIGDVVNSYIGQAEVQRRFTEFDKHKKQWEQDVVKRFEESEALTASKLKKLNELSKQGDHFGVLQVVAEFAGKDPIEFEQQMVNQALEMADKFTEMTEDELKAHWAEKKAEAARRELKRREEKDKEKESEAEREATIKKQINKMGLSEAQFAEAYGILKKDPQVMEVLKNLSPEDATTRVCNFYLDSAKEARVEKAVSEIAPNHPEKDKLIDLLFKYSDNDYSVEDIKEVASKYLNVSSSNATETPSKESAAPKEADKPEKTSSGAISDLASLEPEDAVDWDFT